jgi:hypothetical protein
MFRKGMTIAVVAVAGLGLGLAGCGSNSTTSATPSPTASWTAPPSAAANAELGKALSAAHVATAKYATDLAAAEKDGYEIITPMMPGMGYHYMNKTISGAFDASKPPILVYAKDGDAAQLVALEWVFPEKPATPPLAGATYGTFPAACHYADGSFIPKGAQADCASVNPDGGSRFNFWHPDLVTMHVWLWFHNPAGLYNSTNPLVAPFQS